MLPTEPTLVCQEPSQPILRFFCMGDTWVLPLEINGVKAAYPSTLISLDLSSMSISQLSRKLYRKKSGTKY
jgi:hypothetical protein